MKRLLFLVTFACCLLVMNAQNPLGTWSAKPMAGFNITGVSSENYSDFYHDKVRFTGGVEVEYGVKPWLGLSLGAEYLRQVAKVKGSVVYGQAPERTFFSMRGKSVCEYFGFPLLANVYIPHLNGLAVKTGVQMGFAVGSKMNIGYESAKERRDGIYELIPYDPNDDDACSFSINDFCKSVDIGIPVGFSYEYKNIVLDARYYFGLTKIEPTAVKWLFTYFAQNHLGLPEVINKIEYPKDIRNHFLSITLGYRIPLK